MTIESDGQKWSASRAELEQERDFLLRSLDDLEAEYVAGGVDDESYRELRDDYTARAAAVLRSLRDGVDGRPASPTRSPRRRWLAVGGIGAFAVIVALALAAALGARLPGETSSGNTASADGSASSDASMRKRIARLEAAVVAKPDDAASRLLLARFLEADGDVEGALKQYDAVLVVQPTNAEAEAQAGRLLYLTARASVKRNAADTARLVDAARARLDRAVELDPDYPDVRFYRSIVLANEYGDFATAQSDLQRYLILAPNGSFVTQARALLADVTGALEGASPTTRPTSK